MFKKYQVFVALILAVIVAYAGHFFGPYQADSFFFQALWLVGQMFLRLILMIVVPFVLSSLMLGVMDLGREKGFKSILGKTVGLTIVLSSFSVLIGLFLVNWLRPGSSSLLTGLAASSAQLDQILAQSSGQQNWAQTILHLIPKNPFAAMTAALEGEMLSLMIFALIFGYALSTIPKEKTLGLASFLEGLHETSMAIVEKVMMMAPLAVFCMVLYSGLLHGTQIFQSVFSYVFVVILGLFLQMTVVYSLFLWVMKKKNPWQFLLETSEVLLYAFSTASSNASLPRTIKVATDKLKLPESSSRFVLTIGATANQNGTALFEGVTVLFLAQVYGIELSLMDQVQVFLMSILAGIGTAGVPGGSLPLIMVLLKSVGIPAEGIMLILGVDRFLDMARTMLNVCGDLVIATLVAPTRKH